MQIRCYVLAAWLRRLIYAIALTSLGCSDFDSPSYLAPVPFNHAPYSDDRMQICSYVLAVLARQGMFLYMLPL